MKNTSLIFNIVLTIAVIILFVLHFTDKPNVSNEVAISPALKSNNSPLTVYVNGDSLLNNYEFFKKSKKDFEDKGKRTENAILAKRSALEKEFNDYQQTASSMTPEQRARVEESLMKKEQDFKSYSESAAGKLQEEQDKFNEHLFDKVAAYLKEFSKGKNYKIVLNYTKGTGILFANDSLDITADVLKGLNEEYAKK